jgi:hypothetical protein
MGTLIVRAIVLLLLPAAVFLGVGYLMQQLSGHEQVTEHLRQKLGVEKLPKGLGLRPTGYDLAAVKAYWGALSPEALGAERSMLELDLIFPFLYGAAFAGALLCAWLALGRPFQPVWIMAPVIINVVADWTENLIQLCQLKLFTSGAALQPGWIQIASGATMVKIFFFCGSYLFLACLVGWMISTNWPRAPAR